MVISENFIYVPGWDKRAPPNKNNNNNKQIYKYVYIYIYIDRYIFIGGIYLIIVTQIIFVFFLFILGYTQFRYKNTFKFVMTVLRYCNLRLSIVSKIVSYIYCVE